MERARFSRREVLASSAILLTGNAWVRVPCASTDAADVDELVRWIVTTPRESALQRGARELCAGLDPARLLGAVLIAAARDIRTDRPTFNHAALSVSAIDQLTDGAALVTRQRNALWCLDYFKEVQAAETRNDDWRMPAVESSKLPSGAAARAALVDSLERWDREAADVAIAGFFRSAALDEVYALVWEYAPRCVGNIGHKGIYAALSRRALPLAGDRYAEDVLRSVVSSFFIGGRTERAAPFERSRELVVRAIAPRVQRAATDIGPARELLGAIRQHAPEEMPPIVAKLMADGAATSTLWDVMVAAACEVAVASPGIVSLHAFTATNSLHYIARHAPSERVAQLALLQAAAWVADFRRGLETDEAAVRIDEKARGAEELDGFFERARLIGRTKCDDVHEFKLTAAAIEEAGLVSNWVRPFVHVALAPHLPEQDRPDGVRLQRVADAVAVASAR
jgi:hypothetical protein